MDEESDIDWLNSILPPDHKREAVAAMRGYDWQRWLTTAEWLNLSGEEAVHIEWAEDFTIAHAGSGIRTFQAKNRSGHISLAQKQTKALISAAWRRQLPVQTVVWTSQRPAAERGAKLSVPGVLLWQSVARGEADGNALRTFLIEHIDVDEATSQTLQNGDEADFRSLLRRITWVTGEGEISDLRKRVEAQIEVRMAGLGIRNASLSRDVAATMLFNSVADASVQPEPDKRTLTRVGLDKFLAGWNAERLAAAAPEVFARLANYQGYLNPAKKPRGVRKPAVWSPAWFVYANSTIPMIGRHEELVQLDTFAKADAQFAWWAVGGCAGIGKSRLAMETMQSLGNEWTSCLAEVSELDEVKKGLSLDQRHGFVAIEYAAVNSEAVGRFLVDCQRFASEQRHIRVLLVDRDPTPDANWWQELFPPFSRRSTLLETTRFADALILQPLLSSDREILEAWLIAGAADQVRLDDAIMARVQEACGGNPLLLGAAAYALSVGRVDFESVEDLLTGILAREWRRLRSLSDAGHDIAAGLSFVALATVTRSDPRPIEGDDTILPLWREEDGTIKVVLATTRNGKVRLFTWGELPVWFPESIAARFMKQREERDKTLQRLAGSGDVKGAISLASEINGSSLQIQPDLFGEFFLSEYWKRSNSKRDGLPAISDQDLTNQMWAAWRLHPATTIFTLTQLRFKPWAAEAVLRALETLSFLVCPAEGFSGALVTPLSVLMADASVMSASLEQRQIMAASLKRLWNSWPARKEVKYRYFKALKQVINKLPLERAEQERQAFLDLAPDCLEIALEKGDVQMPLHVMDVVFQNAERARIQGDAEHILYLLPILRTLVQSFSEIAEIRDRAAELYFWISVSVTNPATPPGEDSPPQMTFLNAVTGPLQEDILSFTEQKTSDLSEASRTALAQALTNMSLTRLKQGRTTDVEYLVHRITHLWPAFEPLPEQPVLEANGLYNLARAFAADKQWTGAREATDSAICKLSSRVSDHESWIALLHILEFSMSLAASRSDGEILDASYSQFIELAPQEYDLLDAQFYFTRAQVFAEFLIESGLTDVYRRLFYLQSRSNGKRSMGSWLFSLALLSAGFVLSPDSAESSSENLAFYLRSVAQARLGVVGLKAISKSLAYFWAMHGYPTDQELNKLVTFSADRRDDGIDLTITYFVEPVHETYFIRLLRGSEAAFSPAEKSSGLSGAPAPQCLGGNVRRPFQSAIWRIFAAIWCRVEALFQLKKKH